MDLDTLLTHVDRAQDELVALLQDLVRIPSINNGVMPTGNETPVCELIAARLAAAGIASQTLESAPGRGNIVARLAGSKGSPRLLYMAHVGRLCRWENESEWTYPPFGGEVHDGRVWGRGSHDMKGTLAAEIMALLILKRAGVALSGDLMLAACADEEAGGAYGAGWLATTHPELVKADFAVNEGGGAPLKTAQGLAYFLNTGEKGRYEVHITVSGSSFHASQPWRADNPMFKVAAVLTRIQDYRPQVDTSHPMFRHYQSLLNLPEPVTNENIDAPQRSAGRQQRGRGCQSEGAVAANACADDDQGRHQVQQHRRARDDRLRYPQHAQPGHCRRATRVGGSAGRHGGRFMGADPDRGLQRVAGRSLCRAGAQGDGQGHRPRRLPVDTGPDRRLHRLALHAPDGRGHL